MDHRGNTFFSGLVASRSIVSRTPNTRTRYGELLMFVDYEADLINHAVFATYPQFKNGLN